LNVGDLVKFGRINGHTTHLNNKVALYMGEDFIHRDDGVVVENHKVLMVGDPSPMTIDRCLVRWMKVVNNASR
jgi:hypothetical protein